MAVKKQYDSSSIKHYSGTEAVRLKPSMYIGGVDSDALWTIIREVADNSADENAAGRNDYVHIIEDKLGELWVADHGGGIPVGAYIDTKTKKKTGRNTLEVIFSEVHAGGKFDDAAYANSRGTHGIGVTATNALSDLFECWTFNQGKWWYVAFKKGELVTKTEQRKPPKLPHLNTAPKKGTVIHVKPDHTIFEKTAKFDPKKAAQWCELTAYLQAGFTTQLTDKKGKSKSWCYKKGISEYLDKRVKRLECTAIGKPLEWTDAVMDVALSFTDCDGVEVEGFTNGLKNTEGGVHVNALFNALTKAIDPYKLKNQKFTSFDLREGIVGIINLKLSSPRFSSQTKERLVDERADKPVYEAALKAFEAFFRKNKTLAKNICRRAAELKAIKDQFKEDKKALKELSSAKKGSGFASKHSRVNCSPDIREVFLVEGDSAAGTARKARDNNYQEILPMKGKILNVMKKADASKATQSDEILNILKAVGYDPSNKTNPLANLRLSKLILLSDSDSDGYHINTLELTLCAKFMPQLFEMGVVYVAKAAEYAVEVKGVNYYGDSKQDLLAKLPKGTPVPKDILHIKGWGEATPEMLRDLAFNPDTRTLFKVKPVDKSEMTEFTLLMSDNVDYRRKLLGV